MKSTSSNPPFRFGVVNPGLTRGAYPTLRNFRSLSRLRLRTIVSLIPEPPTEDLKAFAELTGVNIVHIAVPRALQLGSSLQSLLLSAVSVCIDKDKFPVYVHCLDGRRITGLLVLLLRRLQGWLPLSAISEYWRYQSLSRAPSLILVDVEKNAREVENFASELSEVVIPEHIPQWLWSGKRSVKLSGVKFVYVPPLSSTSLEMNLQQRHGSTSTSLASTFDQSNAQGGPRNALEESLVTSEPKSVGLSLVTPVEQASATQTLQSTVPISRALSALDLHGLEPPIVARREHSLL